MAVRVSAAVAPSSESFLSSAPVLTRKADAIGRGKISRAAVPRLFMPASVNKESVFTALQAAMALRGFQLHAAHERFVRPTQFGAQILQLVFTERGGALVVSPGAYVRFSQVQHYLDQVSALEPKDHSQSFSMGIDFWRFFHDKSLRFVAFNAGDVWHLAPSLIEAFEDYAVPYFSEHDSLDDLDSVLNDQPNEKCPHRPLPWLRAATGIVAARLVERSKFADLLQTYTREMNTVSRGFYASLFERLIALLPP